jgi:hypothetical protein
MGWVCGLGCGLSEQLDEVEALGGVGGWRLWLWVLLVWLGLGWAVCVCLYVGELGVGGWWLYKMNAASYRSVIV